MHRKRRLLPWLALGLLIPAASLFRSNAGEVSATGSELFRTDIVRPLTLTFTAAEWKAMEPDGAKNMTGGMRGPGGFNPGSDLAKSWLALADTDKDGKISATEWKAFETSRFDAWRDKGEDEITAASLATALSSSFGGGQGGGMIGANGKNGVAASMGVTFKFAHAGIAFAGETISDIGVRFSGNNTYMTSRDAVAKPYKVKIDKYDGDSKLAGVSKFNLRNNINDASAMNEVLSYSLYEAAGVPSPRTGYALLKVTVTGTCDAKSAGVYTVVENVNKGFLKDRFGVKKTALGALFKPSTRDLFGYLGDDWAAYEKIYAAHTTLTGADKARVIAFAKVLKNASDAEFAAALPGYVDIDEMARYLAVTVELGAMDSILSMGQNFYLYLEPKTDRFLLLPWDLDHSFGRWMSGDLSNLSVTHPWSGDNRFLERLFKTESFRTAYLKHLGEFNATLFKPETIAARVDALAATLRPVIAKETPSKLAAFESAISATASAKTELPRQDDAPAGNNNDENRGGRSERGRRGGPGGGEGGGSPIKAYVKARNASVTAQLAGKVVAASSDSRGPGGMRGGPGGDGGPGRFISEALLKAFDADGDKVVTRAELVAAFALEFKAWDTDKDGVLTEKELSAGLSALLPSRDFGPPGGGRDGPPADNNPPEPEDDDND